MVLQAAGWQAIQVQEVGRIAPSVSAGGVATVDLAVGQDVLGRDDVARHHGGPKLIERPTGVP
jgi:hypothetical protein